MKKWNKMKRRKMKKGFEDENLRRNQRLCAFFLSLFYLFAASSGKIYWLSAG